MRRIIVVSLLGVFILSCGSRKKIITKKPDQPIEVIVTEEPKKR